MIDEVDKSSLERLLKTESEEKSTPFVNIGLAILSSCHSSQLGSFLNELGIPSVIAINSS